MADQPKNDEQLSLELDAPASPVRNQPAIEEHTPSNIISFEQAIKLHRDESRKAALRSIISTSEDVREG